MAIRVKTIDHVTLVSSNLECTRAFYVDLLGMQEVPRPPFDFPGLWFQAGATQIHINTSGPEAGLAGPQGGSGSQPARGHHIAFLVDDTHATELELKAAGVEIVAGPWERPDGARQLYVHDPDGYLIELFSLAS